ncbi:RNA polymerase III transcription factor IIIC subunit-domain-containing protein [Mucor mucedo]|uniref:RNA polymerase III transcription factor IIIC subunit-domain-containing protein n=1 Tax=Mucor mucedo TaxID=29922 RepID=UPI00221FE02E|nr:RNA polymerase III transcription factor IIIC subunit-domain-containing protein [Mucor mucedo]KAI7892907.1 RNA polymerase III transcription factor IIIC subunit-domain-containing protein [Mucor mucedo]
MEPEYPTSEIIPIGKKKYFCVEYPGYVKRTERAIETMGGIKSLTEAVADNSFVELRFRATDMFSHPINGYVVKSSKLLVKVTRRVKKVKYSDTIIEDPSWKVEVEGVISKTLRFRGLADFQYLVPKTDKIRQLKEALVKGDVQHIVDYKVADDDSHDDLRNIPPPLFTATEVPFTYQYRQNAPVVRVRMKEADGTYTIKLVNRSLRSASDMTTVRFHEENYPTKSWKLLAKPAKEVDLETIEAVKKLFEERPIWSRHNVSCLLPGKYQKQIKVALCHNAFVFTDGPWRDFWVKYGVDPRTDVKYRMYQNIDVRRFFSPTSKPKPKKHAILRKHLDGVPTKVEERQVNDEEIQGLFIFDGKNVPIEKITYQAIDITDPDILKLIDNPAYYKSEVTKDGGYYYKCVNRRIRVCLRKKHLALLDNGYADPLTDVEDGLLEAIEREKLKDGEGNDDDEEDDGEEGDSRDKKENAVKEAMQAMDKPGSSKRLTEVVDEYMDELVKGDPLHDDEFLDIETLDDYDEDLDAFEEVEGDKEEMMEE